VNKVNLMRWRHPVVALGLSLLLAGCAAASPSEMPAERETTVVVQGAGGTAVTAVPTAVPVVGVNVTALPALATALPQIDQPLLPQALPAAQATAQPAPAVAAPQRLRAERIALDEVLVPVGLDAQMLPVVPDHNVGWYYYSARPGQGENVVMYAHVLRFRDAPDIPAPFARLHELAVGDEISVDDNGRSYRYRVTAQVTAAPDEVGYMLPKGEERLTLISCIGELVIAEEGVSMTERLITIAEPID
jgi:LPXTG-site transpeptidase (sortase) family protein